jgi:hypothetical protein
MIRFLYLKEFHENNQCKPFHFNVEFIVKV